VLESVDDVGGGVWVEEESEWGGAWLQPKGHSWATGAGAGLPMVEFHPTPMAESMGGERVGK
jgi:hypothetical protein